MREAAEAAEPKTAAEAVQAEGGIPYNTAELLKEQEFTNKAVINEHEAAEGKVSTGTCCSVLVADKLLPIYSSMWDKLLQKNTSMPWMASKSVWMQM